MAETDEFQVDRYRVDYFVNSASVARTIPRIFLYPSASGPVNRVEIRFINAGHEGADAFDGTIVHGGPGRFVVNALRADFATVHRMLQTEEPLTYRQHRPAPGRVSWWRLFSGHEPVGEADEA